LDDRSTVNIMVTRTWIKLIGLNTNLPVKLPCRSPQATSPVPIPSPSSSSLSPSSVQRKPTPVWTQVCFLSLSTHKVKVFWLNCVTVRYRQGAVPSLNSLSIVTKYTPPCFRSRSVWHVKQNIKDPSTAMSGHSNILVLLDSEHRSQQLRTTLTSLRTTTR